jgi:hypothetical protein
MKAYMILLISLGRVIRTPPNFAWCLMVIPEGIWLLRSYREARILKSYSPTGRYPIGEVSEDPLTLFDQTWD